MTNKLHEPYSTRIIKFILKAIWTIIGILTNMIWYVFTNLPKSVSLGLFPFSLIIASGYNPTTIPNDDKAFIIFDTPTPKEQRLKELEGTTWSRSDIDWYIEESANEYSVSADYMHKIIACESGYVQDIQSKHVQSYGQEESFGLSQIHLPAHPHVTYEQATDPEFAIDFLAKNLSHGRASMWSCSRMV